MQGYYVTTKETNVSGNESKKLPKGIALDVIQATENTLTLSNGDWIDSNDAVLIDGDVSADGGSVIGNKEGFKTTLVYAGIALAFVFYFIWKKK